MKSNRNKIKNDVLQKTELEISKIQTDYEKLIKTLEEALEKKLVELKKEEEEHKLLHDKYEAMCGRAKMENIWSKSLFFIPIIFCSLAWLAMDIWFKLYSNYAPEYNRIFSRANYNWCKYYLLELTSSG